MTVNIPLPIPAAEASFRQNFFRVLFPVPHCEEAARKGPSRYRGALRMPMQAWHSLRYSRMREERLSRYRGALRMLMQAWHSLRYSRKKRWYYAVNSFLLHEYHPWCPYVCTRISAWPCGDPVLIISTTFVKTLVTIQNHSQNRGYAAFLLLMFLASPNRFKKICVHECKHSSV